jgi:hypothetical protein
MWDFSEETQPTARKDYLCGASDWLSNYSDDEFDELELTIIARARHENNKILKGTKYIKVTGKWEGEFSTFRARIDLNDICIKHNAYDE